MLHTKGSRREFGLLRCGTRMIRQRTAVRQSHHPDVVLVQLVCTSSHPSMRAHGILPVATPCQLRRCLTCSASVGCGTAGGRRSEATQASRYSRRFLNRTSVPLSRRAARSAWPWSANSGSGSGGGDQRRQGGGREGTQEVTRRAIQGPGAPDEAYVSAEALRSCGRGPAGARPVWCL